MDPNAFDDHLGHAAGHGSDCTLAPASDDRSPAVTTGAGCLARSRPAQPPRRRRQSYGLAVFLGRRVAAGCAPAAGTTSVTVDSASWSGAEKAPDAVTQTTWGLEPLVGGW